MSARITALLALACLTVATASAQFESIDLQTAVEVALVHRPEAQTMNARIEAERAARLIGLGLSGPTLQFDREGMSDGGFMEQRLMISQELPNPVGLGAQLAQRSLAVEALEADRETVEAEIRESVKSAYIDVLYSRQLLGLRGRAVELGYQLLQAVEARIEVGESAEIDLLKAQLQEAEARDLLDEAERLYHRARYGLFRAMGLEPDDQQYSVQFADSLAFNDVVVDQDAVLARIDLFPEVRSAGLRREAAAKARTIAAQRMAPRPFAGYTRQDFGDGFSFDALQFGLRLPVAEWFSGGASRRIAEAKLTAGDAEQLRVVLDMKEDIERRWHSYDVSRRTLKRYEDSIRGRGELLVSLTREGYLLGELDLLTLLDAQRTYIASRVRYLDAMRNYHRDLVRLERYAGREFAFVD